MKPEEREKAISLRGQRLTYSEIAKTANVSKGSLSRWLREIPHTPREATLEKVRAMQIQNTRATSARLKAEKRDRVNSGLANGKAEIKTFGLTELRMVGAMAYWAEGSKTVDSVVKFTNTDPELIMVMVRWLREVCNVPERKLRIHLRLHPGEDIQEAERFWSEKTGIPLEQFYRTTLKVSGSGGKTKRKLRWGIASVIVCDTRLFYRIKGWINALKEGFLATEAIKQWPW
jgi:hypothetical protein